MFFDNFYVNIYSVYIMNRWRGKVAVVTGASSGTGEDIARRLVEEGLQVVGIARNIELIEANSTKLTGKPGKLHALKCDVTKEEQVAETFKWIKDNLGPVHILINNAGVVKENFFCDGDPKVWKEVLDTNLYGVALCSHAAVKQMREADVSGHIVNINSIAGHKVVNMSPNDYNMYAPSKHGVTAFTEVLRQELIHFKTKIKVSSISPGLVQNTNIFKAGNFSRFTSQAVDDSPHLLPEDVSDGVIYILSTKPNVQVHELTLKPIGEPF